MNTRQKGSEAEEIASEYLISKGFTFLDKNKYYRAGEIDLIMQNNGFIVFVEVKSIEKSSDYSIYETLTKSKLNRLKHSIYTWVNENDMFNAIWRLDFVGIVLNNGKIDSIEHFENIEL